MSTRPLESARDRKYTRIFAGQASNRIRYVLQWQSGLAEVRRVLKPSGRFFFEEVTRAALERWLYRTFLDHPAENRFSKQEFVAELQAVGIKLISGTRSLLRDDIFVGVGRRVE